MTRIKLCGLSRPLDIMTANELMPDYIGFVFAPASRRYVPPQEAGRLRKMLRPGIQAVGVFVDEAPEAVARLMGNGTIDLAQLHGHEDEAYISRLRSLTAGKIIQAFRIRSEEDLRRAVRSSADHILLDSGAGTGSVFDWKLLKAEKSERQYLLAGGLDCRNVREAVRQLHPWAVDVSSGIETGGVKDAGKMADFVYAVREESHKFEESLPAETE